MKKSPVLSIISLISGILGVLTGFFFVGIVFSIAGVVLGFLGKSKEPGAKGMWLTGIITGFVGILLFVIVLIVVIAAAAYVNSVGSSY